MINFNQHIIPESNLKLTYNNRAFKYGDGLFDTLKFENGKIHYLEDHYFRLMSSMRMLRMKIPMNFTLHFYEEQIIKTVFANPKAVKSRIRVSIFRKDGGLYAPENKEIDMIIETDSLLEKQYDTYEMDLFKDFSIYSGVISNIKTNNRITNVMAGIYASEYNFQNCVLINEKKHIVEAINANIFLIKNQDIFTPHLSEGCINGIIRKKLLEKISQSKSHNIYETSISPFELLKSDEVFITNSIVGIQSVTKYRKKQYEIDQTEKIIDLMKL